MTERWVSYGVWQAAMLEASGVPCERAYLNAQDNPMFEHDNRDGSAYDLFGKFRAGELLVEGQAIMTAYRHISMISGFVRCKQMEWTPEYETELEFKEYKYSERKQAA